MVCECVTWHPVQYNLKPAAALGMATIKAALDDRTGTGFISKLQSLLGVSLVRGVGAVLTRGKL